MKKIITFLLTVLFLLSFTPNLYARDLKVYVKGELVEFDTQPVIIKGRTMVPLRSISEFLGVSIRWEGDKKRVVIYTDRMIILHIGSKTATYYSTATDIELDVEPFIKDGRTFVPLRFIAECFNKNVVYNSKNHTVHIDDLIQDGWFIDNKSNYKIKTFRDLKFGNRELYNHKGKAYTYEVSVTPFYTEEDLSKPVCGMRSTYSITPDSGEFEKELEEKVKSNLEKDNYKIIEKTENSYLIYYEYMEEGWTNRLRINVAYIKYDNGNILVAEFDAVDTYYEEYKEEIIENLKTIQSIKWSFNFYNK